MPSKRIDIGKPSYKEKFLQYKGNVRDIRQIVQDLRIGQDLSLVPKLRDEYTQFPVVAVVPLINALDEDFALGRIPEKKRDVAERFIEINLKAFNLTGFGLTGSFDPESMLQYQTLPGPPGSIVKFYRRGIKDGNENILSKAYVYVGSEEEVNAEIKERIEALKDLLGLLSRLKGEYEKINPA